MLCFLILRKEQHMIWKEISSYFMRMKLDHLEIDIKGKILSLIPILIIFRTCLSMRKISEWNNPLNHFKTLEDFRCLILKAGLVKILDSLLSKWLRMCSARPLRMLRGYFIDIQIRNIQRSSNSRSNTLDWQSGSEQLSFIARKWVSMGQKCEFLPTKEWNCHRRENNIEVKLP